MSSFCIRQGETHISLGRGTSPYVICKDERNYPLELPKFLTSHFITPELQDTYASLRQAEIDAVRARQAWLAQLALDLGPQVQSFLDSFPTTHPEAYL